MSQTAFPNLAKAQYMSLTTYRKNGEGIATPVWFAEVDGKLYVTTYTETGKVRRIRNNPQVQIAPCDMRGKILGEAVSAQAKIHLPDSAIGKMANRALTKKYGLAKLLTDFTGLFSKDKGVFLEVERL